VEAAEEGGVKEEAAEEGGVGSTHTTEGSVGSGAGEAEGDINGVEDEDEDGDTTDTDSRLRDPDWTRSTASDAESDATESAYSVATESTF
jgi:hypothetical protein